MFPRTSGKYQVLTGGGMGFSPLELKKLLEFDENKARDVIKL